MSSTDKLIEKQTARETPEQTEERKRKGRKDWIKGMESPWPEGRPRQGVNLPAKTNRELRSQALMELIRKFKPHVSKSIMSAVNIIDDNEANDANKLKASALIIGTYKDLLKDVYDHRYDTEENEEIQANNGPVFSLKMIDPDEKAA